MTVNNQFNIGEFVYLKTDPEQQKRIVTAITVKPNNSLIYEVSFINHYQIFNEFELSSEQDIILKTSN